MYQKRSEVYMLIVFIRTVIIFGILISVLRLMGKRHLGELEIGELVTTLMISEIATLPLENPSIPLLYAIVPLSTLMLFEVGISMILTKFPKLKNLISPRPSVIIRKGVLDQKELRRLRISMDEFLSALRQNNITDISNVNYAIMEQNAKITVVPKAEASPPNAKDMNITCRDSGIPHILIADGVTNEYNLKNSNKTHDWLASELKKRNCSEKEVFLLTVNDLDEVYLILKEETKKGDTQ